MSTVKTSEINSSRTTQKRSSEGDRSGKLKANSDTTSKKLQISLRSAVTALALMLWVWVAVVVSQIVVGYTMIGIIGREGILQPVPYAIHSALSYTLSLILIILVPIVIIPMRRDSAAKKSAKDSGKKTTPTTRASFTAERSRLGLKGLPTWTDIGLAPVGFVIYLVLAVALTMVFSIFPWFDISETQEIGFALTISGADRVVAFLTLVVVAPIAEEIIFRGWLYGRLRDNTFKKLSVAWRIGWSVFLTSLLFGILHQQWNVGVNVFAMSVVLCGLREFTGTIYAGILLHMLKNGLAFYSLFVAGLG